MNDNNVYKKVGRKYVPIGYRVDESWLSDGIWIVRHTRRHSTEMVNAKYLLDTYGIVKVGDIPTLDIRPVAALEDYAEIVTGILAANVTGRLSMYDLARRIVGEIFAFNEKKKREAPK